MLVKLFINISLHEIPSYAKRFFLIPECFESDYCFFGITVVVESIPFLKSILVSIYTPRPSQKKWIANFCFKKQPTFPKKVNCK